MRCLFPLIDAMLLILFGVTLGVLGYRLDQERQIDSAHQWLLTMNDYLESRPSSAPILACSDPQPLCWSLCPWLTHPILSDWTLRVEPLGQSSVRQSSVRQSYLLSARRGDLLLLKESGHPVIRLEGAQAAED